MPGYYSRPNYIAGKACWMGDGNPSSSIMLFLMSCPAIMKGLIFWLAVEVCKFAMKFA